MKIQVTARSIYELGQRSNQEDSIYPFFSKEPTKGDLFILCDGMGGHESGEVASQTVCQAMSNYVKAHPRSDGYFDEKDFDKALDAAYDALDAKDTEVEKKMGTTLTFVKFHAGGCFVAHIGDSRIYHIRPATKSILHVTRDHSLVNDLISLGELTPEQAKTSKQKNIITRAMQPHQDRRVQADCVNLTDLQEGDYVYMCSDGMLEVSEDAEIVNILSMQRSDAEKIDILKGATSENRDNHSAHLIHILSVDWEKTKPVASIKDTIVEEPEAESAPKAKPKEVDPSPRRSPFRKLVSLVIIAFLVFGLMHWLHKPKDEEPKVNQTEVQRPARQQDTQKSDKQKPDKQKPQTQQSSAETQGVPVMTPVENSNRPEASEPESVPAAASTAASLVESSAPTGSTVEEEADVEAQYGVLSITTIPPGASIWIDGTDTGKKTSAEVKLSAREYIVELKLDGYKTYKQSIKIKADKPNSIVNKLDKIQ